MPDYYLITEEREEPIEPVFDIRTYKKPDPINLLLPSVHASREHNFLLKESDGDVQEAVDALLAACSDSSTWPSSTLHSGAANLYNAQQLHPGRSHNSLSYRDDFALQTDTTSQLPKMPSQPKYKPPSWTYDTIEPRVINAARELFFDRKRQLSMHGSYHTGVPRFPTDYELFAAWACLPRAEKMSYISEVGGVRGLSDTPSPHNSLETQRAVNVLCASCPDSLHWPSMQYSRAQAQAFAPRTNPALFSFSSHSHSPLHSSPTHHHPPLPL